MALSDQLILETRQAFRELDALQGRLDRISDVRLDVQIDTSSLNADIERSQRLAQDTASAFGQINDQVVLTTDEYRQAVRAIEEGESAARAVAIATGDIASESAGVEAAYRRIAGSLGITEEEAQQLGTEVRQAVIDASDLEFNLREVAQSMNLTEAEASQFTAEMRRASNEASTLDARTDSLAVGWGRIRGLIIGAVAAFGVRGLVRQFDQAIDSTLALSESINAVNVTFDEGAESVLTFAETAAESAGLAASQAQQLVVPIGALLRNFGFEAQAAGEAAVVLTQRAADLASVFNTEVPEALTAIQAALRGEADPLERFGASISAARVEAFALSEGLAATKSEIDDSIRLQARYALILEDTSRAAGDFAATSDEAANRQRILAAEAEDARAALGEALLPAFEAILDIAPRFIVDVAAMSESVREMAGQAEDAQGPLITLADIIGGLPRGFGVLGDVATGFGSALRSAARASGSLFTRPLSQGIDDFTTNIEEGTNAIGGMIDSLQQRAILESFVSDLKEGVDPALAFANAVAATARNNELTVDSFQALARISGASDDRLRDATIAMLDAGASAGFSAEEIAILRIQLALLSAGRPEGIASSDRAIARLGDTASGTAGDIADLEEEVDPVVGALEELERISDDTGLSVAEVARNIGLIEPELVPLVNQIGAGTLAAEAFNQSFSTLATAVTLDFGDAVDEFELLISVTNEAGDEVPATVEQMLTDLRTQAERFARLELATAILEASGFDALAAELREQGPEAVEAAEAFVEDTQAALEAESLLEDGARLGDEALEGLRTALAAGDITPELLELAAQFTSDQVRNEILLAAATAGGLFVEEMQRVIASLPLELRLTPEIIALSPQLGPAGPGATGFGAPGDGGDVTFNQTNNFNTTPVPTTDTQRITQTTSNVIRSNLQ